MNLKAKCLVSLGFLLGAFGVAHADSITLSSADVGTSFDVNYNSIVHNAVLPDLNSTATFTLASVVGNTWTFDIDLTVLATNGITARVSGLAFNTSPDLVNASASGIFNFAVLGGSLPNGIGSVDVCFKNNSDPECGHGGQSGGTSTSGSFTVALDFGAPITSLTLDNFAVRYQNILGLDCGCEGGTGVGTIATALVPEPATWSLLILGFGVLGYRVRASRKAVA